MQRKIYHIFLIFIAIPFLFFGCKEHKEVVLSQKEKTQNVKNISNNEKENGVKNKEEELKSKLRAHLDKLSDNLKNANHHNLKNNATQIHNDRFLQMQKIIFNLKIPNQTPKMQKALQHQQKQMEKLNQKNAKIMQ